MHEHMLTLHNEPHPQSTTKQTERMFSVTLHVHFYFQESFKALPFLSNQTVMNITFFKDLQTKSGNTPTLYYRLSYWVCWSISLIWWHVSDQNQIILLFSLMKKRKPLSNSLRCWTKTDDVFDIGSAKEGTFMFKEFWGISLDSG